MKIKKNNNKSYFELKCIRFESNEFKNSNGPYFSQIQETDNEESVTGVKRKYPEIKEEMQLEVNDINLEIQKEEEYLEKLYKRKARLVVGELKMYE